MKSVAGTNPTLAEQIRVVALPDGRELRYVLTRKRVKNVNFRPKADGIIWVSANTRVKISEIERFIAERAEYFFSAFTRVRAREESTRTDIHNVKWLGEVYPVRIIASSRECAVFEKLENSRECRVFTHHPEDENISTLIKTTVEKNFIALCKELNDEVREALMKKGYSPPPTCITVKDMSSRWGSCSYSRGRISLNIHLAFYPRETVLSVLWHEYSHYWHHDHSDRFYAFVLSMYPDYYKWNGLLK